MKAHTPCHLHVFHSVPTTPYRRSRRLIPLLILLAMLVGAELTSLRAQTPDIQSGGLTPRLQFKIDPKTPLKDLLPPAPRPERLAGPLQHNDLSRVPEVQFQTPLRVAKDEAIAQIAHQIAKINHLNEMKTDGFIETLRSARPDLNGLPFVMGDACRTKGERNKQFAAAVAMVNSALQQADIRAPEPVPPHATEWFWETYRNACAIADNTQPQARPEQRETIALVRIAALTQILMPMTEMDPELANYLSTLPHVEATRALARMAIFSADEDGRKAAVEALKVRRERDYTEILVNGLRYPWPAVARRAADAIVKLERNDLLSQLIDVLEQPDPRAPVKREVKGKSVPVVSELVRVNHHRSCLLCHAPGNTGKVSGDAVTAEVPVLGQPLNPPSGGYNTSQPDILVRVDVTYLRQDFSALLPVDDANPWPEMQRFDYLVRTRVLSDEEAATYAAKLKPRQPGEFSPYQRAALAALRELTGRDTEPTPDAWRRLLKLAAQIQRKTS